MSDLTVWTIPEEALHADLRAVLEAWGGRGITLRGPYFGEYLTHDRRQAIRSANVYVLVEEA